jgi:hypothetical protein
MVFRARRDFRKIKNDFLEKRKENLQKTTLENIPEIFCQSIVYQYYVKGEKLFSELKTSTKKLV